MLSDLAQDATKKLAERFGIELEKQGQRFKLRTYSLEKGDHVCGKRGLISRFTAQSRKRMIDLFQSLCLKQIMRMKERPKFITLTYGQQYPDPLTTKKHQKAFLERIRRRWPDACIIWRFEFQDRGAPHLHFIALNVPYISFYVIRQWWEEIIGWDPTREKAAHVRVEIKRIRAYRQLMYYVSKYCAKVDDSSFLVNGTYSHVGRWWGVFGRKNLPLARLTVARVPAGPWFFKMRRIAKRLFKSMRMPREIGSGFTLYVSDPDKFFDWGIILSIG